MEYDKISWIQTVILCADDLGCDVMKGTEYFASFWTTAGLPGEYKFTVDSEK